MSAEYEQGFTVRHPAWHDLDIRLPDYPGRAAAMELAGHDFEVIERNVFTRVNDGFHDVDGWKALVAHGGKNDGSLLNIARDSYTIIQNSVGWDIMDALLGEGVKYEGAGLLKGGAVAYALAFLDEPQRAKGWDTDVYPFVCVNWAHDGSAAFRARATSVAVVCMNTLTMSEAESKKSGREFTFRHTKNVQARIDEARTVLQGVRGQASAFIALAEELTAMRYDTTSGTFAGSLDPKRAADTEAKFISEFIPQPVGQVVSDRVIANIDEARALVRSLLAGPTVEGVGIRGTAWGFVQAGTEYLDHIRGARNSETKFGRQLLRDEPLKARLVPMARELVNA